MGRASTAYFIFLTHIPLFVRKFFWFSWLTHFAKLLNCYIARLLNFGHWQRKKTPKLQKSSYVVVTYTFKTEGGGTGERVKHCLNKAWKKKKSNFVSVGFLKVPPSYQSLVSGGRGLKGCCPQGQKPSPLALQHPVRNEKKMICLYLYFFKPILAILLFLKSHP